MESGSTFAAQALLLVMQLSLPPILVASIVGITFSLFQAITQLQEQTLSFGVKLIATGIALFMMSDWLCGSLLRFSEEVFDKFQLF
ncbi:MAG: type III secretion system export apparatus subunit SctS [Desulfovibrionaceae bacterium]|nr:type III secretion system export apparatus subunit SctS [Desulfovibrionaceae bacterium]